MRQGAEQSAPTSLPYTITCMIMLIIVNRIQFLYYSSYLNFSSIDTTLLSSACEGSGGGDWPAGYPRIYTTRFNSMRKVVPLPISDSLTKMRPA